MTVNRQEKYRELRQRFPIFAYKEYSYSFGSEGMRAEFLFELRNAAGDVAYSFRPTLYIPQRKFYNSPENIPSSLWQSLVFHCGMTELVSYWKAACSPLVRVECGRLDAEQISWFKNLYFNGLGEFFYVNGIDADKENFMRMECGGTDFSKAVEADGCVREDGVLVPVGGGKDSVVTLEIMREAEGVEVRPFIINPRGATLNCACTAGFSEEDCAVVQRSIHPQLLDLNAQGFLNGHTPFSAMLAFTSLLVSALTGFKHIALSNEGSANESTVEGSGVNHQYSKSFEFETAFRAYVSKYICKNAFNYFSFLRPLSELGIARLFASYPAYHAVFRSCNAGSKTDTWCGNCPKCLFAFIILSPFMGIEKCARVFGKNLLDDISLKPYLEQLCGIQEVKPFECVGTRGEVNFALQQLCAEKEKYALLRYYFDMPVSRIPQPELLLEDFSPANCVPEKFSVPLKRKISQVRNLKKLEPFFDTGEKPVAIVGLGREGKSSYKTLRAVKPELKLILVDADPAVKENELWKNDSNVEFITGTRYLETLCSRASETGLILKTPGVSFKDFPSLNTASNVSSQTDIFLKCFSKQIIGVTGTKGKSTTTLLIYHILKDYKPCVLAGNMGIPFFDVLPDIRPETCVVCEFSCHQLEHVHSAPHIGVLLNLYEEHLDHYASFLDYQNAKVNILGGTGNKPDSGGKYFYNAEDERIVARIKERYGEDALKVHTEFVPFFPSRKDTLLYIEGNPLIGKHNAVNTFVALAASCAAGMEKERAEQRIKTFQPLPHRLQYVGCIDGKHFFNDSISTVPQAAVAAVESISGLPYIKGVDCLILGGMDRGIDYAPLEDYLKQDKVKNLIFVGEAGRRIQRELQEKNYTPQQGLASNDYKEIVAWCKENTRKGYACVLSPAAASYDMFKNFEHRGQVFMDLLKG